LTSAHQNYPKRKKIIKFYKKKKKKFQIFWERGLNRVPKRFLRMRDHLIKMQKKLKASMRLRRKNNAGLLKKHNPEHKQIICILGIFFE
jgi:hypothetical protein